MRSRFDGPEEVTPGCDFVLPAFGSGVPKRTIAPRCRREAVEGGPGPGAYAVGRQIGSDAPRASFHGAGDRGPALDGDRSPGPAQYAPPPAGIGEQAPRFTMKGTRHKPKTEPTGEYTVLGSTLAKPKIVIRVRPPFDGYG
jgi:hypothetical protein